MLVSEQLKFDRALRAHQVADLDRFAECRETFLAWEMGTGKTTEAIALLRWKYRTKGNVDKTLIISPVATLYNWVDEFKINSPEKVWAECLVPYMRTRKAKYTCAERAELIKLTNKRIIILNGESLDDDKVTEALREWCPVNVVIDEAHCFKSPNRFSGNPKKRRPSRPARLQGIIAKSENRILMTGTPIANGYLDLWSQFLLLDGGKTFGTNFYVFRETYFFDRNLKWKQTGATGYFPDFQPKPNVDKLIAEKLKAKMSRRTKDECLDLPPLLQLTHAVEMHADQAKEYERMEKELLASVEGGTCAASNALSKVNRLLQILSGHLPVEHDDTGEKFLSYFKVNTRLKALEELLEALTPKHKVIVWADFSASYEPIRKLIAKYNPAEIVGGTKNRFEEMARFQSADACRVMLSNPKAGGTGINLTAASYAIYYSHTYSLLDRLQSEARNHRGGSEIHANITLIDLVVKGTIEEDVLSALIRKENFADSVLDRLKAQR